MTRAILSLALLAACWKGAPGAPVAAPPVEAPPAFEMLVLQYGERYTTVAQFLKLSSLGGEPVVVRSVDLPTANVEAWRWLGRDLALLGWDPDHIVFQIGLLTASGYRVLPKPPDSIWPDLQQPDLDHFSDPEWSLTSTANDELWLGRCEWGSLADHATCTEWAYAKVWPISGTPTAVVTPAPVQRRPAYALSSIPAPADTRTELVDDPGGPNGEEPVHQILRCTRGGTTVEYPVAGDRGAGYFGMSDLVWLQTDPPMFRVTRSETCLDICTRPVIFEGCAPSRRFETATVIPGPDGVFALAAERHTSIRWRGKELGRIDEAVQTFAFVPPVSGATPAR